LDARCSFKYAALPFLADIKVGEKEAKWENRKGEWG